MPDDPENSEKQVEPGIVETSIDVRKLVMEEDLSNPVVLAQRVYQICWRWADFHLYVISPHISSISPPIIIEPEVIEGSDDVEFVYPIQDRGSQLSTSKGAEMYYAGMSMCKLYFTIEKMIHILIERLKSGGISMETEVQIAFGGHKLAQRKAFESVINLSYNVIVTNFEPGIWGERYLETVKQIAEKGYGYPSETPREPYRQIHNPSGARIKH